MHKIYIGAKIYAGDFVPNGNSKAIIKVYCGHHVNMFYLIIYCW